MGEHTPSPWTAGRFSSVLGLPVTAQPDPAKNSIIICGVRGDRDLAEANARLIAAAPDMLAALRTIASGTKDDEPPFTAMPREEMARIARAAIDKARGR